MKKAKSIEELHGILYDMLLEVDRICKENNIRYFLAFGTEIGAVRDHAFIPWDDDIDIKVMREDYENFKAAMKANLKGPLKFTEPVDLRPYFFDFVPRIINTEYTLSDSEMLQGHPAVDVFLVDHVPAGRVFQKGMYLKLKLVHALSISKRQWIDYKDYHGLQKAGIFLLSSVGKLFSLDTLIRMYDRQQRKYEKVTTPFRFTSNFAFGIQAMYDFDIYEKSIDVVLEKDSFPCPARYDEELRLVYGDYMTPRKMGIVHYEENE
jgi:lipopolysaccharide cholinephosphotransferase